VEVGDDLKEIEGIGQAISEKIGELFDTGKLRFWEKLAAELPPSLVDVLAIPDVGPKLVKAMWEELGIATVADVKAAALEGKLKTLPRMGAKSEARILSNIEAMERRETGRVHLGVAWPLARQIVTALKELPETLQIEPAGSLRRIVKPSAIGYCRATEQPAQLWLPSKTCP
jgi:DNA polymerase (family 10)